MLFLRVFSPWVRSCRSVRFGIFSPRPGLSFSCSPRQSTTSRSFDLALFAFLLLSFVACVLHFRRVWFSLQKLQSFHTKRKKHISNKMDSEEEKKEDKGEHINLKVKDQVRFCRRCFVAAAVLVFKRALSSSSSSRIVF